MENNIARVVFSIEPGYDIERAAEGVIANTNKLPHAKQRILSYIVANLNDEEFKNAQHLEMFKGGKVERDKNGTAYVVYPNIKKMLFVIQVTKVMDNPFLKSV